MAKKRIYIMRLMFRFNRISYEIECYELRHVVL